MSISKISQIYLYIFRKKLTFIYKAHEKWHSLNIWVGFIVSNFERNSTFTKHIRGLELSTLSIIKWEYCKCSWLDQWVVGNSMLCLLLIECVWFNYKILLQKNILNVKSSFLFSAKKRGGKKKKKKQLHWGIDKCWLK